MSLHALHFVTVLALSGIPYLFWLAQGQGYALEFANRSVTISDSMPSVAASEQFSLTFSSTSNVGSLVFEYCTAPLLPGTACTAPTGLDASAATLGQQTGNTGFVIDAADSTASKVVLSRPAAPVAGVGSTYAFDNVTNPSTANISTFVRITSYASSDGTGSYIDHGAVAFSTQSNYQVGAYIPPFLNLCVGVTVSLDCSKSSGDSLDLGVLSPLATQAATSQLSASSNDVNGYRLFVLGPTMTSGNNVIPSAPNPSGSQRGSSEFGINLRRNNNPAIGADPAGPGTAAPDNGYNAPNLFSFEQGSEIANSPISSDYTLMTVSYIVNVNNSQAPGVYATTLTYLATAEF